MENKVKLSSQDGLVLEVFFNKKTKGLKRSCYKVTSHKHDN